MMRSAFVKSCKLALFAAAIVLPAQASAAYTCTTNPAICIAICGDRTCGRIAANDPDTKRLESSSSAQNTLSAATKKTPYTCFNPAICRAVCGSPSC